MRWPWEPERIQPGDTVLRCPRCQGIECEARSALGIDVNRGGRIVGILTGHRWFCMRCGDVFCSGSGGTFAPYGLQAQAAPEGQPIVEQVGDTRRELPRPPRPQRPLPLKPPPVP